MSNLEALITIETSNLSQVIGAGAVTVHGGVNVTPRGGSGNVDITTGNSDYEACQGAARRTANEAFPDRRNLWERITGAPDLNAQRRAAYERQGDDRCLAIARGGNTAPAPHH